MARPPSIDRPMAEALLEAHEAGAEIQDLADLMGVNRMTIYRHFRALGWRGTRGGHNRDWVIHQIVQALRKRGLSHREIGERFGRSASWAYQILKTHTKPRSPGQERGR